MQKKKFATKLSAGLLAAFIVMQGMFPTVAVFADEALNLPELYSTLLVQDYLEQSVCVCVSTCVCMQCYPS